MTECARSIAILVSTIVLCGSAASHAATRTWDGGDGNWGDSNWSGGGAAPAAGDSAVIGSGNVLLDTSTPSLSSLELTGTLTFTNWSTALQATNVTVKNGGVMQHIACDTNPVVANTNRVYVLCSNLTIEAGGAIDVDELGYRGAPASASDPKEWYWGQGPGAGYRKAGGYGGEGGRTYYSSGAGGGTYGSANAPVYPGSGGGNHHVNWAGHGGGAVRIVADGTVTVDGTITANGKSTNNQGAGGSGGGIYITCHRLLGAAGGAILAEGGDGNDAAGGGGGGGGGRVAVLHASGEQFDGTRSVDPGWFDSWYDGQTGTFVVVYTGTDPLLTVAGDPAEYGTPTPHEYGMHAILESAALTESVPFRVDEGGGLKRGCIGYSLTTNSISVDSGTSTQAVFAMPGEDALLTWHWTNLYALTVNTSPGGTVNTSVNGDYTNGTTVQISATATGAFAFAFWTGDIPLEDREENPVDVVMDQVRNIQANFQSTIPVTRTWSGDGHWSSAANWTPEGAPGSYDDAIIGGGSVTLTYPVRLSSLTLTSDSLMTCSNWGTSVTAVDIALRDTSAMTHSIIDTESTPGVSNRVYLICTNLLVEGGASINVDYKGFRGGTPPIAGQREPGQGPGGAPQTGGAGYGGVGAAGFYSPNTPGDIYGSVSNPPAMPGSGGGGHNLGSQYEGTAGGGCVQIEASEHVCMSGTISANGLDRTTQGGNGSGGGIYISCNTFASTGGVLRADGGNNGSHFSHGGSGGGGRVVLHYDAGGQGALNATDKPSVTISASQGAADSGHNAEPGTIYLTDASFFPSNAPTLYGGVLHIPGFTTWSADSLAIAEGRLVLPTGMALTVANNLSISGDGGGLQSSNATIAIGGNLTGNASKLGRSFIYGGSSAALDVSGNVSWLSGRMYMWGDGDGQTDINGDLHVEAEVHWYAPTSGCALHVGTDVTVTNGGAFHVHGASTNGSFDHGALVAVDRDVTIYTNSWIHAHSDSDNGGSPLFRMQNLTIADSGAGFNADGAGFSGTAGPGKGTLTGSGWAGGGGFGGDGGDGSTGAGGGTYGDLTAPLSPGSGGGRSANDGGGLVRIEATATMTLNGTISAGGMAYAEGDGGGNGGGAGGGIYLSCEKLYGLNAVLSADGGSANTTSGGGGGGGRIAVWREQHYADTNTWTVTADGGPAADSGEDGTVYWGIIPPSGTVISLQ